MLHVNLIIHIDAIEVDIENTERNLGTAEIVLVY